MKITRITFHEQCGFMPCSDWEVVIDTDLGEMRLFFVKVPPLEFIEKEAKEKYAEWLASITELRQEEAAREATKQGRLVAYGYDKLIGKEF